MGDFKKVLSKFEQNIERYISIFVLIAMFVLISWQVILRFVFNNPNPWSEELARYCHIYMIFICCSYATQQGVHIKVDAIMNIYPPRIRPIIKTLGELVWLAFCVFIVVISAKMTKDVFRMGQISVALKIPLGLVYIAVPIGYTLTSFRIVQRKVKDFINWKNTRLTAEGKGGVDNA